jgi:Tol biopolymer transport system component
VIAPAAPANRRNSMLIGGAIIALLTLAAAGYFFFGRSAPVGPAPFQSFAISQLTHSGEAAAAAISPDGKFILSVRSTNGEQSLWLRNIPTDSDTQVIPPAPVTYRSLAFSPDGNYIYFRQATDRTLSAWNLYRAPVLGGTPQVIGRDIDTNISFSPDGKLMAYGRFNDPELNKFRLLTANPDGSGEKVLLISPSNDGAFNLAWSPDGKHIALSLRQPGKYLGGIDMFNVASGRTQQFARFADKVPYELVWLPDGRNLLADYSRSLPGPAPAHAQIGIVSYPAGTFHTITNDTNNYTTLTTSSDGKALATVQVQTLGEIDVLPGTSRGTAAPLASLPKWQEVMGLDWEPSDQLLVSQGDRLVSMPVNGGNSVTLTSESSGSLALPSSCTDGRYILFTWVGRGGANSANIWRANPDGSNPTRLTNGSRDAFAQCSPDGKWVYYSDMSKFRLMRVPIGGGASEVVPGSAVPNALLSGFALSPDGKMLGYLVSIANAATMNVISKLVLVDIAANGKSAPRLLDVDPRTTDTPVRFTPDGKAVGYVIQDKGVDNIWIQPLDGSKGRQLTGFSSQQIKQLAWSSDGKRLAVVRMQSSSDVILLRESTQ